MVVGSSKVTSHGMLDGIGTAPDWGLHAKEYRSSVAVSDSSRAVCDAFI
jgi:hypothetical protein